MKIYKGNLYLVSNFSLSSSICGAIELSRSVFCFVCSIFSQLMPLPIFFCIYRTSETGPRHGFIAPGCRDERTNV